MRARKETSAIGSILRSLAFGVGIGAAVCTLILLIAAAIMTSGVIPPAAVTPIALAAVAIGTFVGGFVSARISRERGLVYGAGVGALFWLLLAIVGVSSDTFSGSMLLLKAALTIGLGALGGVLGVNVKKRR